MPYIKQFKIENIYAINAWIFHHEEIWYRIAFHYKNILCHTTPFMIMLVRSINHLISDKATNLKNQDRNDFHQDH